MLNLSIPHVEPQLHPRITVIGVGGAGGNAVNNMIKAKLEGVEFVVANTDAQALAGMLAERKLQLGIGITQGLGAGSRPDVGRAAAEEVIEQITSFLENSNMVFITAGMGGGTGTGAAPVIARAAREMGILTVGVVTKPFHFEGAHRMRVAEAGLHELQQFVDTLIIIPNQNLFRIANEKTTFADAFKMADDVLHSGVRGVTDLMVMPGLINLDFADIRTVMSEMGKAMMGTGESEGDKRAVHAAEAAISNPLLDDVSMKGARGVLINITGGLDMTLYEVDEAANRIRDEVDPDANIIFGSTFDESMEGRVRVSVVATGIDLEAQTKPLPTASAITGLGGRRNTVPQPKQPALAVVAQQAEPVKAPAPQPMPQVVAAAAVAELEEEAVEPEPVRRPAAASVTAGSLRGERQGGTFIPPQPVARPVPQARTSTQAVAEPEPITAQDGARRRTGSLFRRMTGLLYPEDEGIPARQAPRGPTPPAAAGRPATAAPAAQPRLEMNQRAPLPRHEDDALDIPAFLRRQAN